MRSGPDGRDKWGAKVLVASGFLFLFLGGVADIAGKEAYAQEKIILKGVPYFHQRWHFD